MHESMPPSRESTCHELKDKIGKYKYVMVFFGNELDPLYEDVYFKFADNSENRMWFAHTDDLECAKQYNVEAP